MGGSLLRHRVWPDSHWDRGQGTKVLVLSLIEPEALVKALCPSGPWPPHMSSGDCSNWSQAFQLQQQALQWSVFLSDTVQVGSADSPWCLNCVEAEASVGCVTQQQTCPGRKEAVSIRPRSRVFELEGV